MSNNEPEAEEDGAAAGGADVGAGEESKRLMISFAALAFVACAVGAELEASLALEPKISARRS
jgi:hypothetical protein